MDPTGLYIVLPEGTEITSVPDKDANGNYVKPSGLADDDGLIWDSLFTRGPKGTGIAGSDIMGGIVTDIINDADPVAIKVADLGIEYSGVVSTTSGPATNLFGNEPIPVTITFSTSFVKEGQLHEISAENFTLILAHELVHADQRLRLGVTFDFYGMWAREYNAHDFQARLAAEFGGSYINEIKYVPKRFLTERLFGSFLYSSFISAVATGNMHARDITPR